MAILAGLLIFLAIGMAAVALLFGGKEDRTEERVREMNRKGESGLFERKESKKDVANTARELAMKLGAMAGQDNNEQSRTQLRERLIQAGLYSREAPLVFTGIRLVMMLTPPLIGLFLAAVPLLPSFIGIGPQLEAILIGMVGGVLGMALPGIWLDKRKTARQTQLRRSLPDAMDVIVICMEGGLSLPASLARVAHELRVAHPLLATELSICQREIQLGKTTGEALKDFSIRTDMEEIRSLSGVVSQAEKYGASLAQALRIHAETLRLKRSQRAEELAHQAGTKIIFPTLLFIFPNIFLVILGPAVMKISEMFTQVN